MKLMSKISYLGKNSILPRQMAEQLAVEVKPKKGQKLFFLNNFLTTSKNVRKDPKPFLERFFLTHFENFTYHSI